MNSKRLHLILAAAICLLFIGLIGGAYGINHLLDAEASKLLALKAKSAALQQQRISLNKAKKDIVTYADLQKVTQSIVPEDKNQALAVREIVKLADSNGISLLSISFPASTLGSTSSGAAAKTPAAAPANGPAAAAANKAAGLSQLLAVKNIPGVYQLPITVTADPHKPVPYSKFIAFLSDMEHNRRTAQVSIISIAPDTLNPNLVSFALTLNEYIKP